MTKLKGLLLTEGMHGMISQVEGLANALDIDFTHHKVELNSFWILIPPKFTPVSNFTFNQINPKDFDIIISCGRKSVIPSIYLKKNSEKKFDKDISTIWALLKKNKSDSLVYRRVKELGYGCYLGYWHEGGKEHSIIINFTGGLILNSKEFKNLSIS